MRAPGEVVHDLAEVGFVAHDEDPAVVPGGRQQLERVVDVEARAERLVLHGLARHRLTGQQRGVTGADLRAREDVVEFEAQRDQRAACGERLLAPTIGQTALVVRGARRGARPRRDAAARGGRPWPHPIPTPRPSASQYARIPGLVCVVPSGARHTTL
jgi:hypothetical protein